MQKHLVRAVTVACAVSAFATPALAQDGISCSKLIADTENRRQIPRGLLMAIAVTESGMNGIPNPHAMNIAGKTYHARDLRSEEHTSELQSLMRISYAVFCLKKKKKKITETQIYNTRKYRNKKQ